MPALCRTFGTMAALHGRHTGTAATDRHPARKSWDGERQVVCVASSACLHECAARLQLVGRRTAGTAPKHPRFRGRICGPRGASGDRPRFSAGLRGTLGFRLPVAEEEATAPGCVRPGDESCRLGVLMIRLGDSRCPSLGCLAAGRHQRAARPVRRNAGDSGGDNNLTRLCCCFNYCCAKNKASRGSVQCWAP